MQTGVVVLVNSWYHFHAAITQPDAQSKLISIKTDEKYQGQQIICQLG